MGRKNLYIPDDQENLVERFEKGLGRRGQSLSDFFMQSIKDAMPKPVRTGTPRMGIPAGVDCAIAVDSKWRHSNAINFIVGPPNNVNFRATDSSLIEARVIGSDDPLGLWIELNSDQQRHAGKPILELVIPWRFVFGVCLLQEDRRTKPVFGLPTGESAEVDVTTPRALEIQVSESTAASDAAKVDRRGS